MRNKAQRQYDADKKAILEMDMPPMKLLLVQFNSELLTKNENQTAKEYHDKLYRTRSGYNRLGPVWEIPQWIAEMKLNFPDAHILFADNLADVYDKMGEYTHLAFSALDCNWHLIREIADSFSGSVIVGGYCEPDNLQDLQNVWWFDSVQQCCDNMDMPYYTGVDYRHFTDAKTIGRLSLSSGCRHKCRFCIVPDAVTKTPIADVFQMADEICRLNSPLVYINDKTFGQAENFWLLPQLATYITCRMKVMFDGFIIQTTASQLLKLDDDFLLASGIRYVELGIESYNDSILSAMHKPATEKLIDAATEKLRRLGIRLIPNIMIGLPGETQKTYARTLNWLSDNADIISHLNIYNLAVYDDSELADTIGADYRPDENQTRHGTDAELFACLVYAFGMRCLDK